MELYLNTVSDLLWNTLTFLMKEEAFKPFRIVGGTSLSLQLGHRESVDIDLFTDAEYGSLNFMEIEEILTKSFTYVDKSSIDMVGLGKSYFIGNSKNDAVKLDLFYTDTFVFPIIKEQGIRFSSIEEIAAMKLEVISNNGRKKDFWDLHELLDTFTLEELLSFYEKRYPYGKSRDEVIEQLINFSEAENDFTPICYRDKDWEIIKLDFEDLINNT